MKKRTPEPVEFIVRFAGRYFYTVRNRDGSARGTLVPSFATMMTYRTACVVAKKLRDMGHADAVVTDVYGSPLVVEQVEKTQDTTQSQEFRLVW